MKKDITICDEYFNESITIPVMSISDRIFKGAYFRAMERYIRRVYGFKRCEMARRETVDGRLEVRVKAFGRANLVTSVTPA